VILWDTSFKKSSNIYNNSIFGEISQSEVWGGVECKQTLPLTRGGREVVSEKLSTQVKESSNGKEKQ